MRQWIDWVEDLIAARHCEWIIPRMGGLRDKSAADVTFDDIFPVNMQMLEAYAPGAIFYVPDDEPGYFTSFLLNGMEVPAWLYGYLNVDNNTCLPENGTADEIKDGIFAVMEDSAAATLRRVSAVLLEYEITILTSAVDLVDRRITIVCMSKRSVMQVNQVMSNRKVRAIMPPKAKVMVSTFVEESRRSDDYLSGESRPTQQLITRTFWYEKGEISRNEPQHWSAGMNYENGDIVRIGSIAHRIESEGNTFTVSKRDSRTERDELRRSQVGTPFSPGERAYWQAARTR